jgi:hypothetical protein
MDGVDGLDEVANRTLIGVAERDDADSCSSPPSSSRSSSSLVNCANLHA